MQYKKIIHPKNLGQFKEIEEITEFKPSDNDLTLKIFIGDKDIDIRSLSKRLGEEWIDCSELIDSKNYDYYMFKFNPFIFSE